MLVASISGGLLSLVVFVVVGADGRANSGGLILFFLFCLGRASWLLAAADVARRTSRMEARRESLRDVRSSAAADPTAILYLRPFGADTVLLPRRPLGGGLFSENEAELVFEVLAAAGPVYAIANPDDDELPSLDVYRSPPGGQWRNDILARMRAARVVVLLPGFGLVQSPGLAWELEQIPREVNPERFVLLLPHDQATYEDFRRDVAEIFPKPLPGYPCRRRRRTSDHAIRVIVTFGADWTPTAASVGVFWLSFKGGLGRRLSPVLRRCVREHKVAGNIPDCPRNSTRLGRGQGIEDPYLSTGGVGGAGEPMD
jgi:hypothetical protein